jgi:hypothetical protein
MARPNAFDDLATTTLLCRQLGHAWDVSLITSEKVDRHQMFQVRLECARCHTTRSDSVLADTAALSRRHYGYPEGYLVPNIASWGGRVVFRRNANIVMFKRLMKEGGQK